MPTVNPKFDELEYNTPYKDGEYKATLVKYYVEEAEKSYDISHGLERIPQKVQQVYSDNVIMMQVDEKSVEKVTCTFFESETTIILRFE